MEESEAHINPLPSRKLYKVLIFSIFILYVISISSKMILTAETIYVIEDFNTNKTQFGISSTFYYITYGIMQVALIFFLSKVNLRRYMSLTIALSALTTFAIPFCTNIKMIWVLFALNGIFQAAIWPGCVSILQKYLPDDMIISANQLISAGFSVGTAMAYGISAIFLSLTENWRVSFWFFGIIFLLSVVFFDITVKNLDKFEIEKNEVVDYNSKSEKANSKIKYYFIFTVCLMNFFANFSYYGISGWFPNLLYDVFGVSKSLSTFLTIILPLCVTVGPVFIMRLCEKFRYWNVMTVVSLFSLLLSVLLVFFHAKNILIAFSLSILFLILIKGSSSISSTVVLFKNADLIDVGSYAALTNAFACLSAAISPPIIGSIIDSDKATGWTYSYIYIVVSVVLVIITNFFVTFLIKKLGKNK